MLIDIGMFLRNIFEKRKTQSKEYSYSMEFDGNTFKPVVRENTGESINIDGLYNNIKSEFVGLAILGSKLNLEDFYDPSYNGMNVSYLSINGMFIDIRSLCKSGPGNILLFSTYKDALEGANTLPSYCRKITNTTLQCGIYAVYQNGNSIDMIFKKVGK